MNALWIFPNDTHILGDSAHPLLPHMLTHTGTICLIPKWIIISLHSATRNVVERAFRCMKSKFRRLEKVELNNLEDICNVNVNLCVVQFLYWRERIWWSIRNRNVSNGDRYICIHGSSRPDAESKRERIANSLIWYLINSL